MFAALLVTLSLLSSPSAPALGGDLCELVENLPSKGDPIRRLKVYQAGFRAMERSKGQIKKLSKARRLLEKSSQSLLAKAREVFREKNDTVKRRAVRRFLDRHVYSKTPSLILKDEGFELPTSVSTTLAWLHCREGNRSKAIAQARPGHLEPSSLVAFAALLLLDEARTDEALELLPTLDEKGFIAPFVRAELVLDAQEKIRFHRMATNRAKTQTQHDAVAAQRARHPALKGP